MGRIQRIALLGLLLAVGCKKTREAPAETDRDVALRELMEKMQEQQERARNAPPASEHRCAVEAQTRKLVDGARVESCGRIGPKSTPDARRTTEACILANASGEKPFTGVIERQGIDSVVIDAFVGVGGHDDFRLHAIHYDGCPMGCGNGDPHSTVATCSQLHEDPFRGVACRSEVDRVSCP